MAIGVVKVERHEMTVSERLYLPPEVRAELANQAELLRDIVDNPFTSVGLEPEWLTDTVVVDMQQM